MVEYYLCRGGRGLTCSHKVNTPEGTGCALKEDAYDSHGNLCPYLVKKDIKVIPHNLPDTRGR